LWGKKETWTHPFFKQDSYYNT